MKHRIALALLVIGGLQHAPLYAAAPADLVVRNAEVITLNAENAVADGFAVREGRILFVGAHRDLDTYVGAKTKVVDLGGLVVIPGLIDAHLHPIPFYPSGHRLHRVDVSSKNATDLDSLIARLRGQVLKRPAGDWIFGAGYEDTMLGAHPTREDLDLVSRDHPVIIDHSSGHRAVANSKALELAGVVGTTPNPAGGVFGKDDAGELNGILLETAATYVKKVVPAKPTSAELELGLETTLRMLVGLGLTTVVDATPSKDYWLLPVYESLRRKGKLPLRVVVMLPLDLLQTYDIEGFVEDDWLSVGPVKVFHGNSLSGRTAWLSESYLGRPHDFGIPPARPQPELNKIVQSIHDRGMQAAIHSNGDREIDMVLAAFETLPQQQLRLARHRIEHASVMSEALLSRAQRAGVVLALHSYVYEHGDKMEEYGAKRWDWMHVNRRALDQSIVVAGNSDYPISGANPFLRFQSLTTRQAKSGRVYGATQTISLLEAMTTFTRGAAYSVFQEKEKGSIEVGKLADFVVLEDDIRSVNNDKLAKVRLHSTWIGGERVTTAE